MKNLLFMHIDGIYTYVFYFRMFYFSGLRDVVLSHLAGTSAHTNRCKFLYEALVLFDFILLGE